MNKEEKTYLKLIEYALKIASSKRYTRAEMERKLSAREADEEVVARVMSRLVELKYIDDELYIKDFVEARIKNKPRGLYLIQRELIKKGINKSQILNIIGDLSIDEVSIATALLAKKERKYRDLEANKRKQSASVFLAGKGFKSDTIYKAIENCYSNFEIREP